MTFDEMPDETPPRQIARGLWLIFAPVLAVGLLTFAAGIVAGAASAGKFGVGFWIAIALAAAVVAGTIWMIRRILPLYTLPRSPRMRGARLALYASGLLGAAIGLVFAFVTPDEPGRVMDYLGGSSPLPLPAALLLLAGLVGALAISVRWHALLDEHERAAYEFGAVAAIYVYFTLSAGWWLLWRAELVAAPDWIAIFFIVMAVWMAGWLVRRFR